MKRISEYQHIVTKEMKIMDYFTKEEPDFYVRLRSEFQLLKGIKVYYTNLVPVYIGKNKNSFGLPEIRKRILDKGKYEEFRYISKDSKKLPNIPEWAEFTGYVCNLSEWCDAYQYCNKCAVEVTEKFNGQLEKYELLKIEPIRKTNYELKRNR